MFVPNENEMKLYQNLNIKAVKGGSAIYNGDNRLTATLKHADAFALKRRLSKILKFR